MMGPRQVAQGALFYEFSIEEFVPGGHPLRGIDRFLDVSDVRPLLAPSYGSHGRPSIDPELIIHCPAVRCEATSRDFGQGVGQIINAALYVALMTC